MSVDPIVETTNKILEAQKILKVLDENVGHESSDFCTYDIGSGSVGPGGKNGRYIRRCKNAASSLVPNTPICRTHARITLKRNIVEGEAELASLKGTDMRIAGVKNLKVYNPATILITGKDFDKFKGNTACFANVAHKTGGVYGFDNAVCKALGDVYGLGRAIETKEEPTPVAVTHESGDGTATNPNP